MGTGGATPHPLVSVGAGTPTSGPPSVSPVSQFCSLLPCRESFAFYKTLMMAHPYLLQSKAKVNFAFTDACVISYISRLKPFSNFLQGLAEERIGENL